MQTKTIALYGCKGEGSQHKKAGHPTKAPRGEEKSKSQSINHQLYAKLYEVTIPWHSSQRAKQTAWAGVRVKDQPMSAT